MKKFSVLLLTGLMVPFMTGCSAVGIAQIVAPYVATDVVSTFVLRALGM